MAKENWDRTYVCKIGPKNKTGILIGNNKGQIPLHISFSVEKSNSESCNTAKISIYNLSDKSLKSISQKDCRLELSAGYGNDRALILYGDVTTITTTREDADRVTEIEVVDGRVALRDAYLSISLKGKVGSKKVYNNLAKTMGISVVYGKDVKFKSYPRGFSFSGKARTALQKVAETNGHKWSIQNGVLTVVTKGKALQNKGYKLTSKTGLVGIPKMITQSDTEGDSSKNNGYEINYLLNGAIGVNDIVYIETTDVKGYFLIKSVQIDGDNVQGDWMCKAEVMQLKE